MLNEKVVVTTVRGVFYRTLIEDASPGKVVLENAQCAVYWSADVRGFVGLAANGPSSTCRISPPAPRQTLYAITSINLCTDKAAAEWEKQPWSK